MRPRLTLYLPPKPPAKRNGVCLDGIRRVQQSRRSCMRAARMALAGKPIGS